jgi:CheY-like chemotaxis protein
MKVEAEQAQYGQVSARLKSVLVVENTRYDRLVIREELKKLGIRNHVHGVATATEMIAYLNGIEQFAHRDEYPLPAVIVVNLNLPGVDGFEAIEWVRSHTAFCDIPMIALGTSAQLGALKAAVKLGADGWMVKPFDVVEFHRIAGERRMEVEFHLSEILRDSPQTFFR